MTFYLSLITMNRVTICIVLLLISLNSYGQKQVNTRAEADSVPHKTMQYKLDAYYSEIIEIPLDTLINTFHRYKKTEHITPFIQGLGNYGLACVETDFTARQTDPEFFIYRHLRNYMHHAANKTYIDTQVPFTELRWTFGGKKKKAEQTLGVRHSQNVNHLLNVGLDLDIIYSLGQYMYQKSEDRSFTLHGSYLGDKYKAFASWSINNLKAYENGGVTDPGTLSEYDDPRNVPVNLGDLSEAKSEIKNMNFQVIQKYTFGGKQKTPNDSTGMIKTKGPGSTVSHIFEYEKGRRLYLDNYPASGFYDSIYIDDGSTYDSLYTRILKNTLRFDFFTSEEAKFRLGIGLGVTNEINLFSQIIPTFDSQEVTADTLSKTGSSNAIIGSLFNRIGDKFGWAARGKLYFTGLRAGDFTLEGNITKVFGEGKKKSELTARGSMRNTGPSWWMNNWGSNHYYWSNDFGSEFRITAGGLYDYPGIKLNASIDYSLITNIFYFDAKALPAQYKEAVSVLTARINKDFHFWKFRSDNSVLLQKSSHTDIIDLPLICARTAFYFDHEFYFSVTGGRLQTQLGFEAEYNTAYYSSAYMPATGVFYNQRETKTGNYPVINVFANIKLKRTRIFVGFDHVNYGLMGYDYFVSPYYPMNIRMFKYGIGWTFYN